MATSEKIQIDPKICHGKPVIRGTRVPVSVVVGSLAAGMSVDDIQAEYGVSQNDVQAALAFANELLEQESFHALPLTAA